MGSLTIDGWSDSDATTSVLSSGDNADVLAGEHLILVPSGALTRVTGFVPPDATRIWLMSVSNGDPTGLLNIVFPHNDVGSIAGQRTMMFGGFTIYTLTPGQSVFLAFIPGNGWFPLVPGVMS